MCFVVAVVVIIVSMELFYFDICILIGSFSTLFQLNDSVFSFCFIFIICFHFVHFFT